jgi:hypothetical protein
MHPGYRKKPTKQKDCELGVPVLYHVWPGDCTGHFRLCFFLTILGYKSPQSSCTCMRKKSKILQLQSTCHYCYTFCLFAHVALREDLPPSQKKSHSYRYPFGWPWNKVAPRTSLPVNTASVSSMLGGGPRVAVVVECTLLWSTQW